MPKRIRRIALLAHPTNTAAPQLVSVVLEWAAARGVKLLLEHTMARKLARDDLGASLPEMAEHSELVLVLGGDGSILQAVRMFAEYDLPVAGINLGHLGFLTLGAPHNALPILNRLRAGQFHVEDRLMLSAQVRREGKIVQQGQALNDVVVVKEPISRVIDLQVSISGTRISAFRGDGIIISTPTGSTAYSLSAGGPIIPPWVDALLLCPLGSHTLYARPVITSDQEIFSAELSCTHSEVVLVLDGQEGFALKHGDQIEVQRAPKKARIVVLQPRTFFKILRRKMKWGK
jgi:NAD+ kinase